MTNQNLDFEELNKKYSLTQEATVEESKAKRKEKRMNNIKVKKENKEKRNLGEWILLVTGVVLSVFLGVILVMNLTIIIKSATSPDEVPSFFGYTPFIVLSDSMEMGKDSIREDDFIVVGPVDTDKLVVDDIVLYQGITNKKFVVTHRIVEIKTVDGKREFITRGDANNTNDPDPVKASQIAGKFRWNNHIIGKVILFARQPLGMIFFIALPVAVFAIYEGIRKNKMNKEQRELLERLKKLESDQIKE